MSLERRGAVNIFSPELFGDNSKCILYLQPALKNKRLVLRKASLKSLGRQKKSGRNFDKYFAGMNKAATFALPSKKWVQRKAEKIFESWETITFCSKKQK